MRAGSRSLAGEGAGGPSEGVEARPEGVEAPAEGVEAEAERGREPEGVEAPAEGGREPEGVEASAEGVEAPAERGRERAGRGREERVRLFVAAELPREVRGALADWRSAALRGIKGLRPLADDHLHITLCFLGWQPASQINMVGGACADIAGSPPELSLGEPVWLPPRRPGVLAVRLEDAGGHLTALQSALSERLHEGGWYAPEKRPYLPHVTVARVGRQARVKPAPLPDPPGLSFRVEWVTLFRSHLSPKGARYEAVAREAVG